MAGSTRRLRKLRLEVLREQPLCQLRLEGCTGISDTVDHIYPVSQFPQLREVKANLQGSCWACNCCASLRVATMASSMLTTIR